MQKIKFPERKYKEVAFETSPQGWSIRLDDKLALTPKQRVLIVPTQILVKEIAQEYEAQEKQVNPESMVFTRLAVIALDLVAEQRSVVLEDTLAYGNTDLLYYRAEEEKLYARQKALWDPVLAWASKRYDIGFTLTQGVMPVAQPKETLARLKATLEAMDIFSLAAIAMLTRLLGSLILALALYETMLSTKEAFDAAVIDEVYQSEFWGLDALTQEKLARVKAEIGHAARFLFLLKTID